MHLTATSIPCITFPTIFPPVSSSSLFLSRPYLLAQVFLHHPPSHCLICTPSDSNLRYCPPIRLAWLVSLSLSELGLHDSPMSSRGHAFLLSFLPWPCTSLAPICRTQGLLEKQGKKRKSPRTLRRAEGPLPDSPPHCSHLPPPPQAGAPK